MKKLSLILLMVALVGLCFTPAWAQDNELDEGVFGTGVQSTWITAWEFDPTVNFGTIFVDFDQYGVFNFMERWSQRIDGFNFDNWGVWAAGLRLPDGAQLRRVRLYAYDAAGTADVFPGTNPEITFQVTRERTFPTSNPTPTTLGAGATSTNAGYTTADAVVGNVTIDNTNNFYWIRVDTNVTAGFEGLTNGDFRHRLLGVRVFWNRQLQTYDRNAATFDDVPGYLPNGDPNPYFNAIESLADAGITVGCGPAPLQNFCPETGIPRKELAVWLYKALGLQFD
jgi:hypothetical protein